MVLSSVMLSSFFSFKKHRQTKAFKFRVHLLTYPFTSWRSNIKHTQVTSALSSLNNKLKCGFSTHSIKFHRINFIDRQQRWSSCLFFFIKINQIYGVTKRKEWTPFFRFFWLSLLHVQSILNNNWCVYVH